MAYLTKDINIAHLVAAVDANNTAKTTDELSFENYKHISFLISVGNIGADAVLTIEKCTSAAGAGNTAIAFNYRKTGAAGGASEDTWGDLTAVASTGLTIANATEDNKAFIVEIDDNEVGETYKFVRAVITPGAAATLVAIFGIMSEPRYQTAVMTSAIS